MNNRVPKRLFTLFIFFICTVAIAANAEGYPRTGAQADLATFSHQVSGTATVVSSNEIRVTNFIYDGGGPAVYFYLGTNDTQQAFVDGISIGGLLSGTIFSNDTVTVSLPAGQSLDGYNAVSVWCVSFSANFGSGAFQPHMESITSSNAVKSLSVSGAAGQSYQLQATANLVDWTDLDLQTNAMGTVNFTDTNALPTRLYRVEVQ